MVISPNQLPCEMLYPFIVYDVLMREHIRNGPCHPNDLRSCLSIYLSSNKHNQPRPHPHHRNCTSNKYFKSYLSVSPHPRPIGPNGKSLEPHKAVSSSGEALSILFIFVIKTSLLLTSFLPLKVTQGNTFITQVALFQFLILQHCKKSAPTSIVIKMFRCTAGELPPDFHYYHHGVSRSFPRRGNWLRNVPGRGPAVYIVTTWRTHHQKQHGTQDLGRMDTIYTM